MFEREIEAQKKQTEQDKKNLEDLARERDLVSKNLSKTSSASQKQVNMNKLAEQAKRNLEQEIQGYKDEATKQRKLIYQLEKERDRFVSEATAIHQETQAALEGVKAKEVEITDLKKKVSEAETRLKQQQVMRCGNVLFFVPLILRGQMVTHFSSRFRTCMRR